jgi:hypothetical protein
LQSQIGKRADLAKANLDKLFFLEKQKAKKTLKIFLKKFGDKKRVRTFAVPNEKRRRVILKSVSK